MTGSSPRGQRPLRRLLGAVRSRRRLRRALVAANALVALGGAGLVAYPFATDAWTHWVVQPAAAARLQEPGYAAVYRSGRLPHAAPVTRLVVPRLRLDTVVVEGVTPEALRAGAGHYPSTPLPGERGNVAIAGHRTTYGRPFRDLDRLRPGDAIELRTPVGTFRYTVTVAPFVVDPDDLSVLRQDHRSLLTLTTCHPERSSRERLVVHAVLAGPGVHHA